MSRITGKDTEPERTVEALLVDRGLVFERHVKDLPGRPDFVIRRKRLVIFVDGDFWHGFRFPLWRHKLSAFWRTKIQATRTRDWRNFARLRRQGWKVLRIWEHQIEQAPDACAERIVNALGRSGGEIVRSKSRTAR